VYSRYHDGTFLGRLHKNSWLGFACLDSHWCISAAIYGTGGWGIIPVHLNELSPTDVRGTFPGFAYQLGNLFAANIVFLEALLAQNLGTAKTPNYASALAIFSLGAFLAVILFIAIGREARGIEFIQADEKEPVAGEVVSARRAAG